MIRRGRLLLAIGSGPGARASSSAKLRRRWYLEDRAEEEEEEQQSGVGRGWGTWGAAGWGVGRSLSYADAVFAVVVYLCRRRGQ